MVLGWGMGVPTVKGRARVAIGIGVGVTVGAGDRVAVVGISVGVDDRGVNVAVEMGASVDVEIDAGTQEARRVARMTVSNIFIFMSQLERKQPNGLR